MVAIVPTQSRSLLSRAGHALLRFWFEILRIVVSFVAGVGVLACVLSVVILATSSAPARMFVNLAVTMAGGQADEVVALGLIALVYLVLAGAVVLITLKRGVFAAGSRLGRLARFLRARKEDAPLAPAEPIIDVTGGLELPDWARPAPQTTNA